MPSEVDDIVRVFRAAGLNLCTKENVEGSVRSVLADLDAYHKSADADRKERERVRQQLVLIREALGAPVGATDGDVIRLCTMLVDAVEGFPGVRKALGCDESAMASVVATRGAQLVRLYGDLILALGAKHLAPERILSALRIMMDRDLTVEHAADHVQADRRLLKEWQDALAAVGVPGEGKRKVLLATLALRHEITRRPHVDDANSSNPDKAFDGGARHELELLARVAGVPVVADEPDLHLRDRIVAVIEAGRAALQEASHA